LILKDEEDDRDQNNGGKKSYSEKRILEVHRCRERIGRFAFE